MVTSKQHTASTRNIKKAATAAKRARTILGDRGGLKAIELQLGLPRCADLSG